MWKEQKSMTMGYLAQYSKINPLMTTKHIDAGSSKWALFLGTTNTVCAPVFVLQLRLLAPPAQSKLSVTAPVIALAFILMIGSWENWIRICDHYDHFV